MLTGDKIETAINIGKNCELISKHSDIIVLNNPKKIRPKFRKSSTTNRTKTEIHFSHKWPSLRTYKKN